MQESTFAVDVFGQFEPQDLRIVWRDEPRPPHAALDAMIAQTWADLCREHEHRGTLLFNGQLVRPLRRRLERGRLIIDVGPTDYAEFMGSNFLNYQRGDEFGWELYSNALGISATVITADGWLLYGRRNQRVACLPGYVHTFGGCIERNELRGDGTFDAFAGIRRELDEELRLQPQEIAELHCLGIVQDRQIRQPELIFDAAVRCTRAELAARLRPGDPHEEHEAVVACRDEPPAVVPFIRAADLIAPVAVGALCLHGRRRFGEQWYASIEKDP